VVALNTLNVGRFKIAPMWSAQPSRSSRKPLSTQRAGFIGKPICEFGLIKQKIADMS